jgi:DNA-binding beta-propeller fold protein YncE
MKTIIFLGSFLSLVALQLSNSSCQTSTGKTVSLISSIPLAGVRGRIDHMAFDTKRQFIYVAALGNNTVEVIDLKSKKLVHSIKGMKEPQGIRYIPESNAIFIANGNSGECDVFDADSYKKITSVKLLSDADNVRYDPESSKVYVGYGEGAIAIIDAKSFKQLTHVKLHGHPESFQLDSEAGKLFVNVPDSKILAIIDLTKNTVTDKWKVEIASANFPMALDSKNHRLFIGCRNPAKLLVLNSETGKTLDVINIDADTDDIFYDSFSKQIFVSCGSGYIDVIKQIDPDKFGEILRIESLSGARTSLFVPELNELIIASPARAGHEAQLMIYEVKQ